MSDEESISAIRMALALHIDTLLQLKGKGKCNSQSRWDGIQQLASKVHAQFKLSGTKLLHGPGGQAHSWPARSAPGTDELFQPQAAKVAVSIDIPKEET